MASAFENAESAKECFSELYAESPYFIHISNLVGFVEINFSNSSIACKYCFCENRILAFRILASINVGSNFKAVLKSSIASKFFPSPEFDSPL